MDIEDLMRGIDSDDEDVSSQIEADRVRRRQAFEANPTYKTTPPQARRRKRALQRAEEKKKNRDAKQLRAAAMTSTVESKSRTAALIEENRKFLSAGQNRARVEELVRDLAKQEFDDRNQFIRYLDRAKRKHTLVIKNSLISEVYSDMEASGKIDAPYIKFYLRTKVGKSASGILSITVFTSPYPEYTDSKTGKKKKQKFSCQWNCYFCPNHPDHPRSYLPDEPGCLRAERCGFDAVAQLTERVSTLCAIGHPVDKLEVLVLGGTWESYPLEYREEYIRDLFWAANTFFEPADEKRPRGTLLEEQKINEGTRCKIIGLTLETRPDTINADAIKTLRYYGCTRLQIGLQHTRNDILDLINRAHTIEDGARAIKMLKDNCFKIDIHLMPDLPGASPKTDNEMFNDLLGVKSHHDLGAGVHEYELVNDALQVDQWKIYPCEVTPWTVIEKWHKEGKYKPYAELDGGDQLRDVIVNAKKQMLPWIRLNRVIRDIPNQHILGGNSNVSMRQDILRYMKKIGLRCNCIRCREVGLSSRGGTPANHKEAELVIRKYNASGATEFFLSFESADRHTIFGFLRLRIKVDFHTGKPLPEDDVVFPVLRHAGLVRELHVYGQLIPTYMRKKETSAQHFGFGRQLMAAAEQLSWKHGCRRVAVIAGVGTRNYYRKLGYHLRDTYLVKYRPFAVHIRHVITAHPELTLLAAISLFVVLVAVLTSSTTWGS